MAPDNNLDDMIRSFSQHFTSDEMILCGGLAVYLVTGVVRDTDDIDAIALNLGNKNMGARIYGYKNDSGVRLDYTFPDNVFDSINLSDKNLRKRSIKSKQYEEGKKVSFLGPEALIATKLTSYCISGDPNQPKYGVKVLRDKDLDDVRNLLKMKNDQELVLDILETVPHLEEVDLGNFYECVLGVMDESRAPISFLKNVFGIARYIAHPEIDNKEKIYLDLLKESSQHQTAKFALKIDETYHKIYS